MQSANGILFIQLVLQLCHNQWYKFPGYNRLITSKIKDVEAALWYASATCENGMESFI